MATKKAAKKQVGRTRQNLEAKVYVRFSSDEKAELEERARRSGRSLSSQIRWTIFGESK